MVVIVSFRALFLKMKGACIETILDSFGVCCTVSKPMFKEYDKLNCHIFNFVSLL